MIITSLLILSLSIVLECNSAPTIYDQRQNGEFNVYGSLDNFMFLLIPSKMSTPNIDLISLLDYKSMARQLIGKKNKESEVLDGPILSIRNEEFDDNIKTGKPYQVNIVKIPKDKDNSGGQDLKDLPKEELKNFKNEAKVTQDLYNSQSLSKDSLKKDDDKERTPSVHQELTNTKDKLKETAVTDSLTQVLRIL